MTDDYLEEIVLLNERIIKMIRKSIRNRVDLSGINTQVSLGYIMFRLVFKTFRQLAQLD